MKEAGTSREAIPANVMGARTYLSTMSNEALRDCVRRHGGCWLWLFELAFRGARMPT